MLRALQLLSVWTVQVLDTVLPLDFVSHLIMIFLFSQYTWKLAHCTDSHQNPLCPKEAEDYEKVIIDYY